MERRGRATVPATAAPRENASTTSTSIGMFMPSSIPELRGRENLGTFLKRFRSCACLSRCDSTLDSETVENRTGTACAELERLHEHSLVENSLKAGQALTKALDKEKSIMQMVIDIGSISEAWRPLTKIAAGLQKAAYDRARREFESLDIGVSEPVPGYFARVHVILMKLARHRVTTPAREIKRRVLGGLTPRFSDEVRLYAIKGQLDLKELENWTARAESFQSYRKRRSASAHVLAVAHAGGCRTRAGGGARGRGRHGRRSTTRHDDGQGHNQQQGHPQQMHPGQQQQPQEQLPQWKQQQRRYPQSHQRGHPWHQQYDPWASWERPSPQHQYRSGAPHQRRQQHRGGDQSYWQQRRMCQHAGRRIISPQSAGQLETRPHQRRRIIRIRPHLQELMSRSTAPASLPRGHRTNTAMDTQPRQVTGLHRRQPPMHLPRRCHHRPDLTDHLHRRLPRNPTGAFHPGTPRPSRHIVCRQASFRIRLGVIGVQTVTV